MSADLEAVRVKVIVTRFVETDAVCFKSVVQDLTGRHSTVADCEEEGGKGEMQRETQRGGRLRMQRSTKVEEGRGPHGGPPRGVTTVGDLLRWAEQQLPFEELIR